MALGLDPNALVGLQRDPSAAVAGWLAGAANTARIIIPNYATRLERHYGRSPSTLGVDFRFRHFGLAVEFEEPVEVAVHDPKRRLDEGLRALVACFGPVTLRNAHLPDRQRMNGQRNVFPSLSFHVDRSRTQDDHTSLFWRDPFDPVQRMPRSSSTLVLANAAAYLQALKEGHREHEFKQLYQLFEAEEIGALVGEVLVELGWRSPQGVGEIALIDNRTVLRASYYPHPEHKGYGISVRYLL